QPLLERHPRRPPETLSRDTDVGAALAWIVGGKRPGHDAGGRAGQVEHLARELEHRALGRVAEIHGPGEVPRRVHHGHAAANHVVDIAEATGLAAVAEDRDVLAAQRLHDEVRHHAAVVAVHARAVGVEYPHELDVERVLAVIIEE